MSREREIDEYLLAKKVERAQARQRELALMPEEQRIKTLKKKREQRLEKLTDSEYRTLGLCDGCFNVAVRYCDNCKEHVCEKHGCLCGLKACVKQLEAVRVALESPEVDEAMKKVTSTVQNCDGLVRTWLEYPDTEQRLSVWARLLPSLDGLTRMNVALPLSELLTSGPVSE
eukprot:gnl/Hemi2/7550_TR2587_c0_g1_i1.p2 gnl/Hemi2/7550_TR2587_c0_g1~~gnl/Hemi2/7550_TR2587_c0_g1_i1.p2  ORF type:complete len:172 (-),score=32.09 gnl/Hemi2/7550_TR2587_c0_g1_i1:580-1095(-)